MFMAESGIGKSQVDIDSLKETLCAQQKLLQKLYNELDAEREASATAASEALSMILRLQGEKAAMKMETEQYKRLAEEKMCHAEESLAIFEDLMYQKEMEVASMDYQVQAYRYKLLSMGCADPGIGEIKFPENLLQRNETLGEISLESLGRRNSAPPSAIKFSYSKKGDVEKENSLSPETNLCTKISEDCENRDLNRSNSDFEKRADGLPNGGLNSYWEEIRKLDGRVKEIAGVSFVNLRSSTRSPSPQLSSGSAYDLTKGSNANEMLVNLRSCSRSPSPQLSSASLHDLAKGSNANEVDVVKHASEILESQINESVRSPGVLDVFEVPSFNRILDTSKSLGKNWEKSIQEDEDKLQNSYCLPEENVESFQKGEPDLFKKMICSSTSENVFHRPNGMDEINCNVALVCPATTVSLTPPRLHQVNRVSEIVEAENQNAVQPLKDREEELKFLNEIREQLSSIQSQITSLKTKQPKRRDELSLDILGEEMLHFWL